MKTKTFKIGEWCNGGIITVEIRGKVISVINKQWDFSQGTRRSSNQTNAEEIERGTILVNEDGAERKIENYISDLSTSYWADQILKWIKSKVKLEVEYNY